MMAERRYESYLRHNFTYALLSLMLLTLREQPVQGFAFTVSSSPQRSATALSSSVSASWALNSTISSSAAAAPMILPKNKNTYFGFLPQSDEQEATVSPFRWPRTTTTTTTVDTSDVRQRRFKVFCDLDGVLCDFAAGVTQVFDLETPITSQNIDAMPRGDLWQRVQQADSFFEHLPWTSCGRQLWTTIAPLQPDILTGVPSYCVSPRFEKFAWCRRELTQLSPGSQFKHVDKAGKFRMHCDKQPTTSSYDCITSSEAAALQQQAWTCNVITCWSERKHHESGPNCVLIDDRVDLKAAWEAKGGIFIHHITGDLDHTLRQLRAHGVLSAVEVNNSRAAAAEHDRLWRRAPFLP